jgi:hypothetical protein
MKRREFLKRAGVAAGAAGSALGQSGRRVAVVVPKDYPAPVQWAADQLRQAVTQTGNIIGDPAKDLTVTAELKRSAAAESLALSVRTDAAHRTIVASGSDTRGLTYALLELADRLRYSEFPYGELANLKPVTERPANRVRSIARLFVSDVEDKPWFNDRAMWPEYLSMLATQRFNRFNLSFGIGYDFLREVTDAYFLFLYPFLVSVPGYNVRAVNLPDSERDHNLAMLRFISDQAALRGLDFQLGIWTHGYQWTNSPNANYTIAGLTPENHAAYSRDALNAVLRACPGITGVTFRVHGESGVAEGSYGFWKTVFDGVARCGRKVEIDMHSKGINQQMIDTALATGMPVKVSPKFWAEHMGLPYHQAAIREQEMPRRDRNDQGFFALSSGSRSFTRYGYADLLREDRRYDVMHRIWPGTQRLLIWGDPVTAAAYSRAFQFCGSAGVEICEPLSFKGRRGSGIAGDRCGYADASLRPHWDWQKYLYTYRVWGRLLYDPEAAPDGWRRYQRSLAAEAALSSASRILPLITTAHCPSAANNNYWPEMYTNQPIVDPRRPNPYSDTPSPKTFGNTSPLDPQLFSRINDFADELLSGKRTGKYSPVEVAQWLDESAAEASRQLAKARGTDPRLPIDAAIQIGLGRFFSDKLRAGVLYGIHEKTGDRTVLEGALKAYRRARETWAEFANRAKGVYMADITVGEQPWLRGHWLDRLPAIDDDIADMERRLETATDASSQQVRAAIAAVLNPQPRTTAPCRHTQPARFRKTEPLPLELSVVGAKRVTLYYRHVNQAERYQTSEMQLSDNKWRAAIPGPYTDSPYPLQYYFEVELSPEAVFLHPGFDPLRTNQPYFLVRI